MSWLPAATSCAALPEIFDEWIELLLLVAKQGNASLVAFVRGSPALRQQHCRTGRTPARCRAGHPDVAADARSGSD